jgi:hypothetical protein
MERLKGKRGKGEKGGEEKGFIYGMSILQF